MSHKPPTRFSIDELNQIMENAKRLILPSGKAGLVRACLLSRQHSLLKPMAFEALLHAPTALLVAPGNPPSRPGVTILEEDPPPVMCRHPAAGVTEFSYVVFSDVAHFYGFMPDKRRHCAPMESLILIEQMAEQGHPVMLDPGARHALNFSREELREWFSLWRNTSLAPDPVEHNACSFHQVSNPSQILLDRLGVFLASLPAVERAYLMYAGTFEQTKDTMTLVLAVSCADEATRLRIRRAIPLLNVGLPGVSLDFMCPLTLHPGLEEGLLNFMPPVYDQSLGQWIGASAPL